MEVSELETSTEELRGLTFDHLSAKLGRSLTRSLPAQNRSRASPVVVIEDDEGATGSNYVSRRRVAAVLGVSVDEARALLGLEPLKTARAINLSRPGSGVPVPSEGDIRPIYDAVRSNGVSMVPTEVAGSLHRQGRWLYRDRLSLGQVPCSLVNGDVRTYNTKGDEETVWVAGSGKGDEGKRFLYATGRRVVAAGGGDYRWALLKNQEAQGALFKCFLLLAYSILAAPRVATVASLFFVIPMPLLADQNLRGFQGSLAAGVEN